MAAKNRSQRRRRQDKLPVAASLVLDDQLKGDVGLLSEDLFDELFPHQIPPPVSVSPAASSSASSSAPASAQTYYVALTPRTPSATPTSTPWALVPVRRAQSATPGQSLGKLTAKFSPSSASLQTFALQLQAVAPSRLSAQGSRHAIEILVLDAVPLPLSTVYVSLEGDLAKRLQNGEGTFYNERPAGVAKSDAAGAAAPEDRLAAAVRIALGSLTVVHAGDLFSLPLSPHPVTHVPPNPGKIMLCEPVVQGVLTDSTKVVVVAGRTTPRHVPGASLGSVREEDEFYSAAEEEAEGRPREEGAAETEDEGMSGLENGNEDEEDGDLSEDSMDDMISLEMPSLSATNPSGVPTMQSGTPLGARGPKTNGVSTPGSVFSSMTATTARPDQPRGRLFKAQGLVRALQSDLLHPKPAPEEDEEARIYVDIASLSKIGCFSGDWVRVEAAEEPPANGFGPLGLGSLSLETESANWRPAKVFSLPQGHGGRPATRIASSRHAGRRTSFFESQGQRPSSPSAYASPVFLANLDSTPYVRIAPLKKKPSPLAGKSATPKVTGASHPPYAREVTIHPVQSQTSVDRMYQTAVLGGLKRHFSSKIRLVRTGDLIAVPVDSRLGKTMQEGPGSAGSEVDDVMTLMAGQNSGSVADSVAWFRIGNVQAQKKDSEEDQGELWASVVCFEALSVRMNVSGAERCRIPGTKDSTWPYYLGLRKTPEPTSTGPQLPILPEDSQRHVSPIRRQLRELLAAATSPRAIGLNMPPVAILLTSTHRNIGKTTTALDACSDVGLHSYSLDAHDILTESEGGGGADVKTQGFLKARSDRAMSCGPHCCALLIRHIDGLTGERTSGTLAEILEEARVLIATANEVDKLSDHVRGLFTHELEITAPDEAERESILRNVVDNRGVNLDPDVELKSVALKTAALVAGDLVDVVDRALVAQHGRLEQLSTSASTTLLPLTPRDVQLAGGPSAQGLTKTDFDHAVDAARKNFSDAIGAPKIPNVSWKDVGGLSGVKEAITETIQLPLERPELFARGLRKRSGMLFYGPPGTGKTLMAKAIATEYSLNFFSVKGPELLNMYVGESEANVRRVFARARDARPCVVFFDELDSVAPKRGNQGDSGGVMDRIVSQLLAELDGMSGGEDGGSSGVFVVGATNRPDLLDPALLRPGRFDKMMYLGVSDTHEKQATILEALTRKFELHPSISLTNIASKLPLTYTGADFYALCSDAMLKAVTRQATAVDSKIRIINAERAAGISSHHRDSNAAADADLPPISTAAFFDHYATPDDVDVLVTEADFFAAQRELIPSVSATELSHYERVRASFEGARQPKDQATDAADASGGSGGSGDSGKGKGKAPEQSYMVKGKGKGKAAAGSDDEDEDEMVARRSAKGKGKAPEPEGFNHGTASDDDGLY